MDQFISIIIFSIPGLLVYFWIQALGLTPTVKHSPTELIALSAIFWVPTTLLSVASFNIVINHLSWHWIGFDLAKINDINELLAISGNFHFILYFVLSSILFSCIVALGWVVIFEFVVLKVINFLRVKRRLVKLSDTTSVWDAFFSKLKERREATLIVEVYKIDKQESRITGSLKESSRPFETDRSLTLEFTSQWKADREIHDYDIGAIYVDLKTGLIVEELIESTRKIKPIEPPTT